MRRKSPVCQIRTVLIVGKPSNLSSDFFLKICTQMASGNRKVFRNLCARIRFFNGGGTGCFEFAAHDPSLSEITAGMALYSHSS